MFQIKFLLNKSAHTHNSGLAKAAIKVCSENSSFIRAAFANRQNVVRHLRERQPFGQLAAAIRNALPATASADHEPLTNGL